MTVSSQNSKLQAALTVVKAAQAKAENKEYQPALEKYELALGALIPLLQNEVNSPQLACQADITITTYSRKEGKTCHSRKSVYRPVIHAFVKFN